MKDFRILGTLCKNMETGELFIVPAKDTKVRQPGGRITKGMTPSVARIEKEKRKDFSLHGRIKKMSTQKL